MIKSILAAFVIVMMFSAQAVATHDLNVIHACADNKSGALRIVTDGSLCDSKKETAHAWSITGPQGPTGGDGATGPTGDTGYGQCSGRVFDYFWTRG